MYDQEIIDSLKNNIIFVIGKLEGLSCIKSLNDKHKLLNTLWELTDLFSRGAKEAYVGRAEYNYSHYDEENSKFAESVIDSVEAEIHKIIEWLDVNKEFDYAVYQELVKYYGSSLSLLGKLKNDLEDSEKSKQRAIKAKNKPLF